MKKWRSVSIVILLVVVMLSSAGMAQAWWGWSFGDPQLTIDGHTVNIWIDIDGDEDEIGASLQGSIPVEVKVPKGADAVVDFESDVLGHSTETEIKYAGSKEITVSVRAASAEDFPMIVKVQVDGQLVATETGETGDNIKLQFELE